MEFRDSSKAELIVSAILAQPLPGGPREITAPSSYG